MSSQRREAVCTDCGAPRSKEAGPCPECESEAKTVLISGTSPGGSDDSAEVTVWDRVRRYTERNPGWTVIAVIALLGSSASGYLGIAVGPIVGFVLSLVFGLVSWKASEESLTVVVRERERR